MSHLAGFGAAAPGARKQVITERGTLHSKAKPKSKRLSIGERMARESEARRAAGSSSRPSSGSSSGSSRDDERSETRRTVRRDRQARRDRRETRRQAPAPVAPPAAPTAAPVAALSATGGGGLFGSAGGGGAGEPPSDALAGLQAAGGGVQPGQLPIELPSEGLLGEGLGRRTPNAPSLRALSSVGGRIF